MPKSPAPPDATQAVSSHRLEAFCDGVIAIAITLLVLEIKLPALAHPDAPALRAALLERWPLLAATVWSFAAIGCYWINHHRLMRLLHGVDHGFILLTLSWLLALCLIPFATGVLGESLHGGDAIRVAALLYLSVLALPAWTWLAAWAWARRRGLVDTALAPAALSRLDRLFAASALLHLLLVVACARWPWPALGLAVLQTLSYLWPMHLPGLPARNRPAPHSGAVSG